MYFYESAIGITLAVMMGGEAERRFIFGSRTTLTPRAALRG